jgi:hypothetical protein
MSNYWRIFSLEQGSTEEQIRRGRGDYWDQQAQTLTVESGALVFRDLDGGLLIAVGPGAWATVEPIDAATAEVDGDD